MLTIKRCKFCEKDFESQSSQNNKKIFCSYECQQEYWRYKRNKTNNFNIREQRRKGNEIRKKVHLNSIQKQLCYGTLLGDGSMSPRSNGKCRLRIGQKDLDYLEYKKKILKPFIVSENPTIDKSNGFGSKNPFYIYETVTHQDFTDMYGLFYRGNRKKRKRYINRKVLNEITPFALLIWYLDDGCYVDQNGISKTCRFGTNAYSLSEHKALKIWFWQKYRIEVKISYHCLNSTYWLRLNVKPSNKLLKLFEPFLNEIPECMQYKLKA